jgi:hypothetical protein
LGAGNTITVGSSDESSVPAAYPCRATVRPRVLLADVGSQASKISSRRQTAANSKTNRRTTPGRAFPDVIPMVLDNDNDEKPLEEIRAPLVNLAGVS